MDSIKAAKSPCSSVPAAFESDAARPVLMAAQKHIAELGGIDQTYAKYADPQAGGITKDGVDQFLKDADVGYLTRKVASGRMHEAIDSLGTKDEVVSKDELNKAWSLMQAMAIPIKG